MHDIQDSIVWKMKTNTLQIQKVITVGTHYQRTVTLLFQKVTKCFQLSCKVLRKLFGTRYSRMDQPKFFKGCFPQILLGPFLNTLFHLSIFSENKVWLSEVIKRTYQAVHQKKENLEVFSCCCKKYQDILALHSAKILLTWVRYHKTN